MQHRKLGPLGHSRDEKPHNVQVIVGVVMVAGWPIAHHVWAGNRVDHSTVPEAIRDYLGARYRVCKTAGSVNTPVGIARTVLRGLRPEHQVFVVEMGAYVPGNIRDLARLAQRDRL